MVNVSNVSLFNSRFIFLSLNVGTGIFILSIRNLYYFMFCFKEQTIGLYMIVYTIM